MGANMGANMQNLSVKMVPETGVEPATNGLGNYCSCT